MLCALATISGRLADSLSLPNTLLRCVCEPVLDLLLPESPILPQVCGLPGGGSSQNVHILH